jgi:hypothetical protein
MAEPFLRQVSGMPAETAATPKLCRSPFGEAGTPSNPAAA